MSGGGQLFADGVDVAGSLGENEAGAAGVDCLRDVGADLFGASFVVGEGAEDCWMEAVSSSLMKLLGGR